MLTDEQIDQVTKAQFGVSWMKDIKRIVIRNYAREIEAEVHKQDTALIRQLVEALGNSSAMESQNMDAANLRHEAIKAGRAWLEGKI